MSTHYPPGTRVRAMNEAGEVVHRDTVVLSVKFWPKGSVLLEVDSSGDRHHSELLVDVWTHEIEATQTESFVTELLTPLDDEPAPAVETRKAVGA